MKMKNLTSILFVAVFSLSVFLVADGSWADTGRYSNINDLADAVASEMKSQNKGKLLYLDPEDIKCSSEDSDYPFSKYLFHELEQALSGGGFSFVGSSADKADVLMDVRYAKRADVVEIYIKLRDHIKDTYLPLKGEYTIGIGRVPPDSLVETVDIRVSRLSKKLAGGFGGTRKLTLFVPPIVEKNKKYSSDFSQYVTDKLKTYLAVNNSFRLIEEKPVLSNLRNVSTIKTSKNPVTSENLELLNADAVLEGHYLEGIQNVTLFLSLKDVKGAVLARANEDIPLQMISHRTKNDMADKVVEIARTEDEQSEGMIRISTTKGGTHQVFREGEVVQFTIKVAKPLYVYIYDINPDGGVTLLYPKEGEKEKQLVPGVIHTLPGEQENWEIKVESPFGTDAVKAFASEKPISLPRLSASAAVKSYRGSTRALARKELQAGLTKQNAINSRDIVDYFMGAAARAGANLYESTVIVETRPK